MVIWPPIEIWVIRPRDGSLWATWHKELPSDHGNERSGILGASKRCETWWSGDLGGSFFLLLQRVGLGIEVGRWVRVPTRPERGGWEREKDIKKQREKQRERGPCMVTVETSPDTPPGRAAKIISASWGVHKHERRAQEAGPWVLRASQAFMSPFFLLYLLLLLSNFFFYFSFYPSLHAAVFESVCSGCLGHGAGGEEAKELACPFYPLEVARVARLLLYIYNCL